MKKYYKKLKKIDFLNSKIIAVIIIIAVMFVAFSIRAQTWDMPLIEEYAHDQVEQRYKQAIEQDITSQNPNLAPSGIQRAVEDNYEQFYEANKEQIDSEKERSSNQLKDYFRGERGTYMPDIDTYHYLRYYDNYLETGIIYDEVTETGYKDTYQVAPLGNERTKQTMHPVISAWTYKIINFFVDVNPYLIFFMIPAIFASFAIIPAFLIGRKFGGNFGGLIASIIIATHQAFVNRSVGGYVSTDSYNILIPLIVLYLLIEAFDSNIRWKQITYGAASGLFIGIFSRIWGGWSFLLVTILAVLISYIAFLFIKKYYFHKSFKNLKEEKTQGLIALSIFLSTYLFVELFNSFGAFLGGLNAMIRRTSIQSSVGDGLWPNVFTTVAELNRASPEQIILSMGGYTLFFMAMIGLILSALPAKNWNKKNYVVLGLGLFFTFLAATIPSGLERSTGLDQGYIFTILIAIPLVIGFLMLTTQKQKTNVPFGLFASIWFIFSIFASTQGVRFTLLLVPGYAIALAITFSKLLTITQNYFEKKKMNPQLALIPLVIVAALLLSAPITAGYESAKNRAPLMNEAWHSSLSEISEITDEDAIITSWWDYGHWFKAIADRRVTFDGASQNTPMAHWSGKMLSTGNETEARGILNMLNCGSRKGFEKMAEGLFDKNYSQITEKEFFETYEFMLEAIKLQREEASQLYNERLSNSQEVLELTHCDAPESIVIVSDDMVGKSPVWGHFGNWDFKKAYTISTLRDKRPSEAVPEIEDLFNVATNEAQNIYSEALTIRGQRNTNAWISPYPSIFTGPASCTEETKSATCNLRALISRGAQDVYISRANIDLQNPENSTLTLQFVNRNTVVGTDEIKPTGVVINGQRTDIEGGEITDIVFKDSKALLAHESLSQGVFIDLYFFDGQEFESFERIVNYESQVTGNVIRAYKVNW